jgi:hypothetical protein
MVTATAPPLTAAGQACIRSPCAGLRSGPAFLTTMAVPAGAKDPEAPHKHSQQHGRKTQGEKSYEIAN